MTTAEPDHNDQKGVPLSNSISEMQSQIEALRAELASYQFTSQLAEVSVIEKKALMDAAYDTYRVLKENWQAEMAFSAKQLELVKTTNTAINATQTQITKALEEEQALEDLAAVFAELDAFFAPRVTWWNNFMAPFQREDTLAFVNCFKSGYKGFLNANEMGLGKTIEGIAAIIYFVEEFYKLYGRMPFMCWSTKKSLVAEAFKELALRAPWLRWMPLQGTTDTKSVMFDMAVQTGMHGVIANYETANTLQKFRDFKFDLIIIDEVHKLKGGASSKPSQIWLNYKQVCANAGFLYFISGTPMVNAASEMWAYMHIFDPVKFDNFKRFERTFSIFDAGTMSYKLDADTLMKSALRGQMISRKKSEVGIQLPDKVRVPRILQLEGEQLKLYQMLMSEFQIWCSKNTQDGKLSMTSILAQLTRQRQLLTYPAGIKYEDPKTGAKKAIDFHESVKIDETMDIIDELVAAGENVLISSTFNEPLYRIQSLCEQRGIKARVLNGSNSGDGSSYSQDFRGNKFPVFLINSSVGEGLNLQKDPKWDGGASYVVMIDLWYSPARNKQVEDRVHRLGAFDNVTIYLLEVEDSVDQLIIDILNDKTAAFESVLEKQELRPLSELKKKFPGIFGAEAA